MIKQVFMVFDSKTNEFGAPFVCVNSAEAVRMFTDISNDDKTQIGLHPEDFSLYHSGQFDTDSGVINQFPIAQRLGFAKDFRKVEDITTLSPELQTALGNVVNVVSLLSQRVDAVVKMIDHGVESAVRDLQTGVKERKSIFKRLVS